MIASLAAFILTSISQYLLSSPENATTWGEMSAHFSLETPQSRTLASQLESSEKVFARHNKECMSTSAELLCMMMLVVDSECLGSSAKGQQ